MTAGISVGSKATTCGMAGRGMNGLTGHVVCYNESIGRYTLELSSGEMLSLRPGNLYAADDIPVSESLPAAKEVPPPPPCPEPKKVASPQFGSKIWLASAALLAVSLLYSSAQTPSAPPASNTPAYTPLGSFNDKEDARALRFGPHALGYDAESCAAACPESTYFALQLNGFCSCESDLLSVTQHGRGECGPLGGQLCNFVYTRASASDQKPRPSDVDVDPYHPHGWRFWRYPHWRLRYWWDPHYYDPDPYYHWGGWYYGWGGWGWGLVSSVVFLGVFAVVVWQLGGGAQGSKTRRADRGWSLGNLWARIERMNIWELFMYANLLERAVYILRRQFR